MNTAWTRPEIRTALVADDDEQARADLIALLNATWPELRVVAEANNGADAWDQFLDKEPDVCFLDVRMPRLTGIEVGQRIRGQARLVLMASAKDVAPDALASVGALHLIKPLDREQACALIDGLRRGHRPLAQPIRASESGLRPAPVRRGARIDTIPGSLGPEPHEVPIEDIVYLEADGRYTRVVQQNGDVQTRRSLKDLVPELDPREFWQIHRYIVVNRRHIQGAVAVGGGAIVLTLKGRPERLPVGPHFLGRFQNTARAEL